MPKIPIITGCCPLSPSKKNPNTNSPPENLGVIAFEPEPEPDVVGSMTSAQGRSSSGRFFKLAV